MAQLAEERLTYTVAEAARLVGLSENTMRKRLTEHPGLYVRVGRRVLVSRRRIREWIDQEGAEDVR